MVELAATRLIALHKNKGKSVAACLKSRTDYAQNPDKTQQGELVSSYECSPLTVDEEFMLSKRQYELMTGRRQKNDVIAYQIRQSFKPGEITAEEANKVGYELAMRFTKGKYAFIVATHTDREHIHNHIIYNSTALDSTRKFRDFLLSGLAVQRLSDLICLEHQLSVIEIKPYRERQKRTLYPPRESNRDKLCAVIDNILLNEKPADFEAFLQKLEQQGYEIKRGKHTSVKGTRQKRFIRFRTLGAGYETEEMMMSRNFTCQPDESTLTTLCPHCLSAFRNARGIRVRRADPYQLTKEPCTYCQTRFGYDYYIQPASPKATYFKKGRFDDEIDCA